MVDLVGWVAGTYDGFTVGQESRGQDCWWERVGLLGGREQDCWAGESRTAGWERGGRLGGRGLGGWAGERLTTVGLLAG